MARLLLNTRHVPGPVRDCCDFSGSGNMFMLRKILLGSMVFGLGASVAWAKWQMDRDVQVAALAAPQEAFWPTERPAISQKSIDLAMLRFNIQLPHDSSAPMFDAQVADRGLTSRTSWYSQAHIRIGPAAFDSWALLGSTLAHEVEVHARQNFWVIGMLDAMGLDGTGMAERQAYAHELTHADRFQLSQWDRSRIDYTMNHYYPTDATKRRPVWGMISHRLSALLALRFPTFP